MGRYNSLIPLGLLMAFRDPATGRIAVVDESDDDNDEIQVGYDFDIDGDDEFDVGEDEEVGARRSREERQAFKRDKKGMSNFERRQRRQHDRRDGDDRAGPSGGGSATKKAKRGMRAVGGSYVLSAAGAWTIQIVSPEGGDVEDIIASAPAGTIITSLTSGYDGGMSGQIDASVFAPGAFGRENIAGLKVEAGVPVTISGTNTATSGTINFTLKILS